MDNICAPGKYDAKNNTCFTIEQLVGMAQAYNRHLTKYRLSPSKDSARLSKMGLIEIKSNKRYLLDELWKRFEAICQGNEVCLTKQHFMNEIVKEMHDDIENNTFRIEGPKNPTDWLSTTDINQIVKQYEPLYPDFKFLDAVPLDCNELSFCSLYQMDFEKYLGESIKRLGVIFNLDKHGEPGSHWVALFINIPKGEIYYNDSTGKRPVGNINQVIQSFQNYYRKKTGQDTTYKYNTIPYQKDNSECGIYTINFIIRMLSGESFEHVVSHPLNFNEINSCRNRFFRNQPTKQTPHKLCDPKV